MAADLGTLSVEITERGIKGVGEEVWKKHVDTIEGFWNSLKRYFDMLEVSGFKLYQDGLVANGEMGLKIVEEGLKSGSKNYEIISRLIQKDAVLVKTEDLALVKKERDHFIDLTKAKTKREQLTSYLKYKLSKNHLLKKRDRFIAERINETLKEGETGILFIGAYHNIIPMLDKDIRINEIKKINKVREYQRLLPFHKKYKEQFEELSRYMVSAVRKDS
jgi:hypothetical protein